MPAMRDAPVVVDQVQLARSVEQNPLDEDARFSLIDAMADDAEVQSVIFMYDSQKDFPAFSPYIYVYKGGAMGSGASVFSARERLQGAGIVRRAGSGRWGLTEEGKRFAAWLVKRNRRCDYFGPTAGAGELLNLAAARSSGFVTCKLAASRSEKQRLLRQFQFHRQPRDPTFRLKSGKQVANNIFL
jgi:hypothetical protein